VKKETSTHFVPNPVATSDVADPLTAGQATVSRSRRRLSLVLPFVSVAVPAAAGTRKTMTRVDDERTSLRDGWILKNSDD
jgi:hypothetical protein